MYEFYILNKEEPLYHIQDIKAETELRNTFRFWINDQEYICKYKRSHIIGGYKSDKDEFWMYLRSANKCITLETALDKRDFDMLLVGADTQDAHIYAVRIIQIMMAD